MLPLHSAWAQAKSVRLPVGITVRVPSGDTPIRPCVDTYNAANETSARQSADSGGCRSAFRTALDRPALKPLPAARYQFGEWETARVNIDYHIEVERHYYSVPYALVHQQMDVHLTGETVEVIHRGVRVASHVRSYLPGKATTLTEHMPKAHQKYVGRTPSRLIEDAQRTGPYTGQLVEAILAAKRHPEQEFGHAWGFCVWRKPIRPSVSRQPPGVA